MLSLLAFCFAEAARTPTATRTQQTADALNKRERKTIGTTDSFAFGFQGQLVLRAVYACWND